MTASAATHLWIVWLDIAFERQGAAVQARAEQIELGAGAQRFGDALSAEMNASIVAIAGASHAIDALYGEIAPLIRVPDSLEEAWRANGTRRHRRIFETLKLGCELRARTNSWPASFGRLYDLRDPVVHAQTAFRATAMHPNGLTHVAQEMVEYCSENATEAVQLTLDVVMTAITHPLAPDLVAWSERMSAVADHLERAGRGLDDGSAANVAR